MAKVSNPMHTAFITALATILASAITAYATLQVAKLREVKEAPKPADLLEPAKPAPSATREGLSARQEGAIASSPLAMRLVEARTLTAQVDIKNADSPQTAQSDPVDAAFCALTAVGSYGGATKGCNLSHRPEGWVLVANARKASSICTALCFNIETTLKAVE